MATKETSTAQVTLSGAFGGEMKYFMGLMIISALILVGSMIGSIQFLGVENAGLGMIIGLVAAGGVFFGGWILIYVSYQTKIGPTHSYTLIVQPENFVWPIHVIKEQDYKVVDNERRETGYRSKTLFFLEDTMFAPLYAVFGIVRECTIHYYGEWKNYSDLQPGTTEYRDMSIPHGHTDMLFVTPVENQYLNMKHDSRSPIFKLIGGRNLYKYFDATKFIPNPVTHKINETTDLATTANNPNGANSFDELQKANEKIRDLEYALGESQRQGQEAVQHANLYEQIQIFSDAGVDSLKDLAGTMGDNIVDLVQSVVAPMHSWDKSLEWFKQVYKKDHMNWIPFVFVFAIFATVLAFIGLSPDLMNQLIAATQNPLLDGTVIIITALVVLGIYYYVRRRRRRS